MSDEFDFFKEVEEEEKPKPKPIPKFEEEKKAPLAPQKPIKEKKKRVPKPKPKLEIPKNLNSVKEMLRFTIQNIGLQFFGYEEIYDKFCEFFGKGIAGYETISRTVRFLRKDKNLLISKERGVFQLAKKGKNHDLNGYLEEKNDD